VAVLRRSPGKGMENEENVREKTQPRCQTGDSRTHSYTLTTIRVSSVVITQVKVLGFEQFGITNTYLN
jgi:hypothetical protein